MVKISVWEGVAKSSVSRHGVACQVGKPWPKSNMCDDCCDHGCNVGARFTTQSYSYVNRVWYWNANHIYYQENWGQIAIFLRI